MNIQDAGDAVIYAFGGPEALYDMRLNDLCERAAREWHSDLIVKFELFNEHERSYVVERMRRHPNVRYFCTWLQFNGRGSNNG